MNNNDKWCTGYNKQMEMIDKPGDAPKIIRCDKCGRRLKPHIVDCHTFGKNHYEEIPGGCWHYGIPAHKVKGYKIPKKSPTRKIK